VPEYLPHYLTDPVAEKAWRKLAAETHRFNYNITIDRLRVHQLVWMADRFAAEDAIWFPHHLDWRGRAYPMASTTCPHPQGRDINRALLEFAEGKPLGNDGADAMAVHVANLFGHDKTTLADRIAWTTANTADLIACAADPTGNRWWTTTDKPWTTLAACFAWAGYADQGPAYVCHLPIHTDATNSGLQHFSALLRDGDGAETVNLRASPTPQDVYARVADKAEAINVDPIWSGKITRKLTKQPTMTYVYAATRNGVARMLDQALGEIDRDRAANGQGPYLDGPYGAALKSLNPTVWTAIGETVVAARSGMAFLKQITPLFDGPIRWTTPAGFPVVHRYDNLTSFRLMVFVGPQKREVQVRFADTTPGVNKRRAGSGIAANFIHSLDASHLMLTAAGCGRAGLALSVIHDSFATHAADIPTLHTILRRTFVEQYTPDVLARFRDEVVTQLPDKQAA
jgi:DNA-directed RNA polymerase